MIQLRGISLSFGEKRIFRQLNWAIPDRSRVGLVGDNGTGKTTLLRAILGQAELDEGAVEITNRRSSRIGYLPQDLAELDPLPVMEYLKRTCGLQELEEAIRAQEEELAHHPPGDGTETVPPPALKAYEASLAAFQARDGYAFEARAKQVLRGIGFRDVDFGKCCTEFSGGWKMRLQLAVILLSRPDVMLLDEPINHLDTESLEWLESYLEDYTGTIVTVAHDRVFLDKIVNQIAELSNQNLTLYKGNYSAFLVEKEKRRQVQEKAIALQQSELKRTQAFVERFRFKATKAKQVQSRLQLLERMEILEGPTQEKTVAIRFPECPKSGREVLSVRHLTKCYGPLEVFRDLAFHIYRGDRIAIVGMNGSGKSTLSRLLAGVEEPTAGEIRLGHQVQLSAFSQESAQNLDYGHTVWEEIRDVPSESNDQDRRNLLGAFLFSGNEIHKPVAVLSGGEKSRLAIVKILLQSANLMILDEPTNHLDLKTKDIFQEALLGYGGTLILISHDRYFLDRLVNRVFEFREGTLREYNGNYSYFIEKRREMTASGGEADHAIDRSPDRRKEDKRREAEARIRLSRLRSGVKRELDGVETSIAELERRKGDYEGRLSDPESLKSSHLIGTWTRELRQINAEADTLYERWQTLASQLEELGASKDA